MSEKEVKLEKRGEKEVKLEKRDISNELWREYEFGGTVYHIERPVTLYYRPGGSTHRVEDSTGVVHCVPVPGERGCVLRWKQTEESGEAVSF